MRYRSYLKKQVFILLSMASVHVLSYHAIRTFNPSDAQLPFSFWGYVSYALVFVFFGAYLKYKKQLSY